MAIRLGNNKWNYKEAPLKSADLNDTFETVANLRLIAFDDSGVVSGSTTVSKTINIPANTGADYDYILVIVRGGIYVQTSTSNENGKVEIELVVDGVSQSTKEIGTGFGDSGGWTSMFRVFSTVHFIYQPTDTQKTNGYSVVVNAVPTATGTVNALTAYLDEVLIFGVKQY